MALIQSEQKLQLGDTAPNFSLPATDGKTYTLDDFSKKIKLIVFMCNHCPYVIPKIDEIQRIAQDFKEHVAVIGISANDAQQYPEDGFENMKKVAQGKAFFYLYDETQQTAKDYGAVCTPDPFLFDENNKLLYHSRIDDGKTTPGQTKEMYTAIQEYIASKKITQQQIPSMGCSIKWKTS